MHICTGILFLFLSINKRKKTHHVLTMANVAFIKFIHFLMNYNLLGDLKQQKFGQKSKIRCQQDCAPSQVGRGGSFLASSSSRCWQQSWLSLACGHITAISAFWGFSLSISACLCVSFPLMKSTIKWDERPTLLQYDHVPT